MRACLRARACSCAANQNHMQGDAQVAPQERGSPVTDNGRLLVPAAARAGCTSCTHRVVGTCFDVVHAPVKSRPATTSAARVQVRRRPAKAECLSPPAMARMRAPRSLYKACTRRRPSGLLRIAPILGPGNSRDPPVPPCPVLPALWCVLHPLQPCGLVHLVLQLLGVPCVWVGDLVGDYYWHGWAAGRRRAGCCACGGRRHAGLPQLPGAAAILTCNETGW